MDRCKVFHLRSSCLSASAQPESCSIVHLFLLGAAGTPFDLAVPVLFHFHGIGVDFDGSFDVSFS